MTVSVPTLHGTVQKSPARPRRGGGGGLSRQRAIWGVIFVLPLIIGLSVFVYGSIAAGVLLAFVQYDAINPPTLVGLENFRYIFQWDLFRIALRNTTFFAIGYTVLSVVLSLAASMLLNRKLRGIVIFRSIYFVPVVSSMVGIALLWTMLYSTDFGVINQLLRKLGLPGVPWLTSTTWALPAMIIMSTWKSIGYYAILYLAALQGVGQDYYDAAAIDGAGAWNRFRNITMPLISPTTFFILVTTLIGSFQVFDQILIMTNGGPAYSTMPLMLLIFREGFNSLRFGNASAIAVVLLVVVLIFSIIQFRSEGRWVHYES
jgi:ABC-type sugar transport system permease subunit